MTKKRAFGLLLSSKELLSLQKAFTYQANKETPMARSLNKVQLIGHLGADPEVRTFQNGGKVCNLRIATSKKWKDRNTGEDREITQWHSIAVFNEGLVRIAEQYLEKGKRVYIEGELETRKWQDQSGQDRYSTEVAIRPFNGELMLLDRPPNRDSQSSGSNQSSSGTATTGGQDIDDEIPF